MNLLTRISIAVFTMGTLSTCEEKNNATLPAPDQVDGGIQRTISYFHGPKESYTRILVEITGEETRVSEFGGNSQSVSLARDVGVNLFDQFLDLKDIESFRHREELTRDTDTSHLFWLYDRDNGYSKYTVPKTRADEIPGLRKWVSDFLTVAANLKTRSEQGADDQLPTRAESKAK